MSDEPASTAAVADANAHAPHEGHEHPPDLAHHFETHEQQFDTGKMGIWVFLVTEVMFFGGLFCIYAVYRSNHPEIFQYAEQYLDKRLGMLNTLVLILSSLTAAWAVRCAQLEQRRGLIFNLSITLACAFIFLGIKSIEYSHKWPVYREVSHALTEANKTGSKTIFVHLGHVNDKPHEASGHESSEGGGGGEHATAETRTEISIQEGRNMNWFFSIYFCLTGLHAIHVIGGIIFFSWLLVRSHLGHFHRNYFGPVDYVALYWHVVDMIWVYLFLLLYLIKPEKYLGT